MAWRFECTIRKLIAEGRANEAATILKERTRMERRPKARYLNSLGVCEAHLGHLELAKEMFGQALLLAPRNAQALNNLGNLSFITKDTDSARDYYLRSLRENAWAPEPRHNLAAMYQDIGHSEKALSSYEDYMMVCQAIRWARIAAASVVVLVLMLILKI